MSAEVAGHLLPFLRTYQAELLSRAGIANTYEDILPTIKGSIRAKYGSVPDDGWHLLCLHDLVRACEISIKSGKPIEVEW